MKDFVMEFLAKGYLMFVFSIRIVKIVIRYAILTVMLETIANEVTYRDLEFKYDTEAM